MLLLTCILAFLFLNVIHTCQTQRKIILKFKVALSLCNTKWMIENVQNISTPFKLSLWLIITSKQFCESSIAKSFLMWTSSSLWISGNISITEKTFIHVVSTKNKLFEHMFDKMCKSLFNNSWNLKSSLDTVSGKFH